MGKKKFPKVPLRKYEPSLSKQPQIASNPDFSDARPAWRISILETVDPFGWHKVSPEALEKVRQRLADLESMTWNEILVKGKKFNHLIPVTNLCREARTRLEEKQLDDIDEICSLRIGSRERIFGILDRFVLRILWWDPNHLICPSHKK